jgi:two-component system, NarL family, sensor kinase
MRMKIIYNCLIILLTILIHSTNALSQQTVIDSLRLAFEKESNPEKKIDTYYSIAYEVMEMNLEKAVPYADTLEQMAETDKSQMAKAHALYLRGHIQKGRGDFMGAIKLFKQDLAIHQQMNNLKEMAQDYNNIGASFSELFQTDSTIIYYLKMADIFEKLNDFSGKASAYANIGNLYADQKAFDKAFLFLEKALQIRLENGEEKKSMYTYNNLTTAYGMAGNIDKAMDYAQKGIAVALKYQNLFVAGVIEGGMGHLLNKKGRYQEAVSYCERSIKYLTDAKRKVNLVFPYVNMATAYNGLNKPQKALEYAQKGYAIMLETKQIDPLGEYYENISTAYEKMGNDKQALFWLKKNIALNDSIFKAENVKNVAEIDTKYQTQRKEAQIALQNLEISEQKAQNFRQRTWLIALIISLLALVAFAYLYYNRYRLKQKAILDAAVIREHELGLNAVIEAQEAERKRISKDLHDGIAQELVALKLGFNRLQNKIEKIAPDEALNIEQLTHQLNDSCTEVRNIAHLMMPPNLETSGLVSALEILLRNSLHHNHIETEFEHFDLPERLNDKTELGLYRIAQELLNNILKHAQASKVMLQLYKAGNQLIMRLEDNGKGFDYETTKNKSSMGLLNILSRVNNLGGTFFSEKGAAVGTVSTIRIPL